MSNALGWVRKHGGAIYLTLLVLLISGGAYVLAVHNAATVTELCQAGNEARAQQVALWDFVIHLSSRPQPGQTAAQRAQHAQAVAEFKHHLNVVFAPRNCGNITRSSP